MTPTVALARDRRLVELHQAGGADAFVELYRLHYPRLVRFCRVSLGSHGHLAEDIAQDAFVRALLRLDSLGDGRQTRCFCWVGDVVAALVALVEHPGAYGKVFNVGGTEEVAIGDLAKRVIALTGSASEIVHVPYEQAYEEGFEDMERRVPDITRVRELVGFAPTKPLDDIVAAVASELGGEGGR